MLKYRLKYLMLESCGFESRGKTRTYFDSFSLSFNADTLHDFHLKCGCAFVRAAGVICARHPEGSSNQYPVEVLALCGWHTGIPVELMRDVASFHPPYACQYKVLQVPVKTVFCAS